MPTGAMLPLRLCITPSLTGSLDLTFTQPMTSLQTKGGADVLQDENKMVKYAMTENKQSVFLVICTIFPFTFDNEMVINHLHFYSGRVSKKLLLSQINRQRKSLAIT
jgi:hypothetical protein